MKSSVETLEPTRVRLTVEVPFEELKSEMDKAYKDIAGQVNIPGFRKGHVPPRIIDQRFGRAAVIEQVVNEVLPGHYSSAVASNDLRPMAQPEVEVTEIPNTTGPQGGQLVFTAEVAVVPPFELPAIDESIEVVVDSAEELEELRGRFATLKTVDRAAAAGDFTTIDLVARIGGEEVDSVSDVSYEIGSGDMLDGQDEALSGASAGDEVAFTAVLKGGDHEGEEAEVSLTVKSVKVRELPTADDDFAQMVSEFDTIGELTEDLRKQAAQSKESQQALQARDRLIDLLLERVEIQLPESAVEHELSHRVEAAGESADQDALRAEVVREMRSELLSEAVAKEFDVQVSQQELIDYAIQMSQNYGVDINQLFSSPQQMSNVVADLGRSKALIEALKRVTVKDSSGAEVDLSKFFGEDPAAAENAEIVGGADSDEAEAPADAEDAAE